MSWEMRSSGHHDLYKEWNEYHRLYITFDQWILDELVETRLRVKMLSGKPITDEPRQSSFN